MPPERIHFITGRLAEFALSAELQRLAPLVGFSYTVEVLPITVAALMTTPWVARHLAGPVAADRAVLPGYCHGELDPVAAVLKIPVERGPHDLRRLGEFFGQAAEPPPDFGARTSKSWPRSITPRGSNSPTSWPRPTGFARPAPT